MCDLSASYIRSVFDYAPTTGVLSWRKIDNPSSKYEKRRNTSFAGKEAGCVDQLGYRVVRLGKKNYKAHRLIWLYVHGRMPSDYIDHINGVKSDNRLSNLREVDSCANNQNKAMHHNSRSGVVGVTWDKKARKWRAHIRANKVGHYLGQYSDINEAIAVRRAAEKAYGFHPNHGR